MNELNKILENIVRCGGKPYFVGGCVRDEILGLKSKDIDVEVYGLSLDALENILCSYGKVDVVGESFGVVKLTTKENDYDFSLPRKENKVGVGHKGFEVDIKSNLSIEEASSRRDFTFNAISKDHEGNLVDPYGGVKDLNNRLLKHCSIQFSEDPLRVLRGFQFCGRFNLIPHHETVSLCRDLKKEFESLPKERVWTEFEKWALKSVNPKAGLDFLLMSGWVDCFPELRDIVGVPQEYEYHPEGDVYCHSAYVCNAMNDICKREGIEGERKLILMLASLCHDLGKATTTCYRKNKISAPGHDKKGGPLTKSFLHSINCPHHIIDVVVPLVVEHMAHINGVNEKVVRKVSHRLGKASIVDLVLLMEADASGRPPKEKGMPENAKMMLDLAIKLDCEYSAPSRIVNGRNLIDVIKPSKDLGVLIDWLYQKQLEGKFDNLLDGLSLAKQHHIYHKHVKMRDENRS